MPEDAVPPRLSRRKKIAFAIVVQVLALFCLEGVARVGSYFVYGRNPYYLYYGFRSWTNDEGAGHSEQYDGYFKFPANDVIEYGTPEPCRINNNGFRGNDYETQKPADTKRVLCLGGSSTFGYLNRDQGTYPRLLQDLFANAEGTNVEVLNAGVPHYNTDHILAALHGELLATSPDVVTIYSAYNDATFPLAETGWQSVSRWSDEHLAVYAGLRKLVNKRSGSVLFGKWSQYLPRMERAAIERQLAIHLERTRSNYETLIAEVQAAGASLIVVRQPITTWPDRKSRGLVDSETPRIPYEAEYELVAEKLENRDWLRGFDVPIYVHHHLVELIDELAAQHGLTVVDNIALADAHPQSLGSKVHLTEEANLRLAKELHRVIAPVLRAR
ncbi:MAG: hypothetical protein GY711_13125 [bacterium]|nr:hypothetical protein [bacterium]